MNERVTPPPTFPPSPFVGADVVTEHRDEVQLVDVRWSLDGTEGEHTYRAGHVPGAVYVDLDADLAGPASDAGGRHPLPTPSAFAAALGARGVDERRPVVAYDTLGGAVAARLVWMLRAIGQPAAVLDGGLAAWDGPLSDRPPAVTPVVRQARPWPADRIVEADDVARWAAGEGRVVDVRAPARFRGEEEPVDPRAGHVPGARNLPIADHLVDGSLDGWEQLRARYDALDVTGEVPIVVTCGSGVNACFGALVLEQLGRPAALFPGSWSAWSRDPHRPVATGPATDRST